MSGTLVPLVLLPRYTSFIGANTYLTVAMDVTAYSKAIVHCWRGGLVGTSPTFAVEFEESTDLNDWDVCSGGSSSDPGTNTEVTIAPSFLKRWFRIKVTLGGALPGVTCWALGFLEMRESQAAGHVSWWSRDDPLGERDTLSWRVRTRSGQHGGHPDGAPPQVGGCPAVAGRGRRQPCPPGPVSRQAHALGGERDGLRRLLRLR